MVAEDISVWWLGPWRFVTVVRSAVYKSYYLLTYLLLLELHLFNGLFSRTTWVSRHQKGNPFWILLEQEMMGWQWHQLDHMQIICTSLHTDNHASTSPLSLSSYYHNLQLKQKLKSWEGSYNKCDRPVVVVVSSRRKMTLCWTVFSNNLQ